MDTTSDNSKCHFLTNESCQISWGNVIWDHAENLLKHMETLKSYRDHINKFPYTEFHVVNTHFKSIISASLHLPWQTFIKPYNGNANKLDDPNHKWQISSDTFIGLLLEEYKICMMRSDNGKYNSASGSVSLVKTQGANSTKKSLEDHIRDHKSSIKPYCNHWKHAGHWLSKCHNLRATNVRTMGKLVTKQRIAGARRRGRKKIKGRIQMSPMQLKNTSHSW